MSFEELLKRISPKLKGIAYKLRRSHPAGLEDEDLLQEALIHLWQDYNYGKLEDKTDSYILQGCYFYLKNHIRKAADKAILLSMYSPAGEDCPAELEDVLLLKNPGALFIDVNNKVLIEEILNDGLTSREKKVFSYLLEGYTVREIAKELGVSHVSVVKSSKRIKEKCRKFRDPD